jgi:perosamine synthetase
MSNPFLPYGKQSIDDSDIEAVTKTLKSDWLTQGPKVKEFEELICKLTDAKYAVAVSNGTAALHMAALACELKKDEEIITSPVTFLASANCALYCQANPIFSDICKDTFNIDPSLIEEKINKNTKAIIPVHLGGVPCDMEKIHEIAKKHNLFVIEDACHAIGSEYNNTKIGSCSHSDMTIFSFHPVKTIATGEGGAITTNNKNLYEKLLLLRTHGITKDPDMLTKNEGPWYYEMHTLGFNYRITDIQCALGISQLSKLKQFKEKRREIVKTYKKAFKQIPWITLQTEPENCSSAFHLCILNIDFEYLKKSRSETMQILNKEGIGTQVHYIPIYKQPYYQQLYNLNHNNYPNAENYYEQALSIPLYPSLKDNEVQRVIKAIISLENK